jgi:nucleotide-binding universal stress UspA family protein
MFETILVPTDGGEHAHRAAAHASYLAGLTGGTVHLVNVVDVQAAAGPFDAGGVDRAFVERLETAGRETVTAAADRVDGPVTTAVLRGTPATAVLEYATANDTDLVAMGTHGRTGLDRYVTGSVAERVLRRAAVPVLTTRATERSRPDYDAVLVPTDGSEAAAAAVTPALELAALADACVHAVCVVGGGLDGAPQDTVDRLEAAAAAATDRIAARARERGLETTTAVEHGRPTRALLDYVDDAAVDLVAMGTQGHTGLDRLLLGSTTAALVRRSPVPVVAVGPGGRE